MPSTRSFFYEEKIEHASVMAEKGLRYQYKKSGLSFSGLCQYVHNELLSVWIAQIQSLGIFHPIVEPTHVRVW